MLRYAERIVENNRIGPSSTNDLIFSDSLTVAQARLALHP